MGKLRQSFTMSRPKFGTVKKTFEPHDTTK